MPDPSNPRGNPHGGGAFKAAVPGSGAARSRAAAPGSFETHRNPDVREETRLDAWRVAPVFVVSKVQESVAYYRDRLGFEVVGTFGEPLEMAFVGRGGTQIMLQDAEGGSIPAANHSYKSVAWDAPFWVGNVRELGEELRRRGAEIRREPTRRSTATSSSRRSIRTDACSASVNRADRRLACGRRRGQIPFAPPSSRGACVRWKTLHDLDWTRWEARDVATLVFVVQDGRILLIRKKRGLGAGKINGPGGRLEPGETPEAGAVREVEEELCVTPVGLRELGENRFQFVDGYSIHVFVFTASGCRGEPTETDEAAPLWVGLDAIPYGEMWEDDQLWLPLVLEGRRFTGRFLFDGDAMLDQAVEVLGEVAARS